MKGSAVLKLPTTYSHEVHLIEIKFKKSHKKRVLRITSQDSFRIH
jgi:hypothetical protein